MASNQSDVARRSWNGLIAMWAIVFLMSCINGELDFAVFSAFLIAVFLWGRSFYV